MIYIATNKQQAKTGQHNTLQFDKSDQLCLLEKSNEWWWLVINKDGEIGYAQISLLESCENDDTDNDHTAKQFVDKAITKLSEISDSKEDYQLSLLSSLRKMQHKLTLSIQRSKSTKVKKRQAPKPPPIPERTTSPSSDDTLQSCGASPTKLSDDTNKTGSLHKNIIEKHSTNSTGTSNQTNKQQDECVLSSNKNLKQAAAHVPNTVAYDLINCVKECANISDACCVDTLHAIFTCVKSNLPHISTEMETLVDLLKSVRLSEAESNIDKLASLFSQLSEFASDEEQSNLAVAESHKVVDLLHEIMTILSDESNEKDNIDFLSQDNFSPVLTLIKYIQMESRIEVRNTLFEAVSIICGMSKKFVSYMLSSVLPCELIRDIIDHINDGERNALPTILLTMILSFDEPYPFIVKNSLDESFIQLILSQIEKESDERLVEIYFHLILAVNLSYLVPEQNLIMNVIGESNFTKTSEQAMFIFNRGDDPVLFNSSCDTNIKNPHSVIKFFVDVFSNVNSHDKFLYTNDFYVLIDIVSRNISDLQPGSKLRTEYLDLFLNIVSHPIYKDTRYRWTELKDVLMRIQSEEDCSELALFDKLIVKKILNDIINDS